MQNQTGLPTFNTNPYLYTQQPLPSPVVSAQQAPSPAPVNNFYPLNNTSLTGPVGGDALNLSTMGAPTATNYTATPTALPAPFVAATPGPDLSQNFQIQLTDALNTQPKKVEAPAPVVNYPFPIAANASSTIIPAYAGQPGNTFNMLA